MRNVAFTRWDPLRDLLALHEQIGQLVGTDTPGWNPPVDLYETAASFVLTAEVAGLSRNDIDIHAEESRVVIRGERSHGPMPSEQPDRQADLKDGLLTVTLPKAAGRGARRIDVT